MLRGVFAPARAEMLPNGRKKKRSVGGQLKGRTRAKHECLSDNKRSKKSGKKEIENVKITAKLMAMNALWFVEDKRAAWGGDEAAFGEWKCTQ